MDIFVGNLSFESTKDDVKKLFEEFGNVSSVAIVMRKEKKTPKSRGFGFVAMLDQQQALNAIAALNGKEFMGRVLNVNPARPKTETEQKDEPKKKKQPESEMEAVLPRRQERQQREARYADTLNKPEEYKGRRTRSFLKQRELAGIKEEIKPRRKYHDNPMRWRKKSDQPKPWEKSPDERKPWQRDGERKPWQKDGERKPWQKDGERKPWQKTEEHKPWKKPGERKPWQKAGESKPWQKTGEHKPWKKAEEGVRTFEKSAGEPKPWRKPEGGYKPWIKKGQRKTESTKKSRRF